MLQKKSIFTRQTRCAGLGEDGEFEGETSGTPFHASLRKGWALFAASSDPTGGRRPCPLGDAGALRASTAEIRGFPRGRPVNTHLQFIGSSGPL